MAFLFNRRRRRGHKGHELGEPVTDAGSRPLTVPWLHEASINSPSELMPMEERRTSVYRKYSQSPHEPSTDYPSIPSELMPMSERAATMYSTVLPMLKGDHATSYIDIWSQDGQMILEQKTLREHQVSDLLHGKGEFLELNERRRPTSSSLGRLRILLADGYYKFGRDNSLLPFSQDTLNQIKTALQLPLSFATMLKEETTRCAQKTLFDESGSVSGTALAVKYFSWWLGTWTLGLHYDLKSNATTALLLGRDSATERGTFLALINSSKHNAGHPMFLPLLLCELLTDRYAHEANLSTRRILALEGSIGVNDYTEASRELRNETNADFTRVSQSLNGEVSRLANYEKWVLSCTALIKELLAGRHFESAKAFSGAKSAPERLTVSLKEHGESIMGRNIDILARIQCQQKIALGQIQTVYNLLAQRDNKLNISIAAASKKDSTAMKTIAIVTMVFLPGAYVATLFSMNMFNWQAQKGEVVSSHFWIYWAVTVPVTVFVLLVWILWARPWK